MTNKAVRRIPVNSKMTLAEAALAASQMYLDTGSNLGTVQVALDVDEGKRKLVVTIAMRVDEVRDFAGMLPGENT